MKKELPSLSALGTLSKKGDQEKQTGIQDKEAAQALHNKSATANNVNKATVLAHRLGVTEKPDGSMAFSIVDSDSSDPEKSPKNEIKVTAQEIKAAISSPTSPTINENLNSKRDQALKLKFEKAMTSKWISLGGSLEAVANLENQPWWGRVYPALVSTFPMMAQKVEAGINTKSPNLAEDVSIQMTLSTVFKNVFQYHEKTGQSLEWIFLNDESPFRINPENHAENPEFFAMEEKSFDAWLGKQFDTEMLNSFGSGA